MLYIALRSFSSSNSVAKGEIIEINDNNTAKDLLNAGYIELVENTDTIIDENKEYRVYK